MAEDNIIIICRHGERIDCSSERNNQKTMKGDRINKNWNKFI